MKVLTFGEILLRLAAPGYTKLLQKDSLDATFCGSEANVAVSLANFGIDSAFLTVVPYNEIGQAAINSVRYFGVDTSKVIFNGDRMGLYYLEKGASQRPSKVIYDRKMSSISEVSAEVFDWDNIFKDVTWFHWSGINPALSDSMKEISEIACKEAKKRNITISCDLNYRSQLWDESKAQDTMYKLMKYVDVCMANEEDAHKMLGITKNDIDVDRANLNIESYQYVANKIVELFGCKYVATSLRKSLSASNNKWSAMLYDSNNRVSYVSKEYDIQIIDRVGSGDSFSAGIIFGLINDYSIIDTVEFAAAASCLKHTIEGDYNRITFEDVNRLLKSGGNGRVQR